MTLHDRLLASLDPMRSRRLLDRIENSVRPTARRRRVIAVMQLRRKDDARMKGETK